MPLLGQVRYIQNPIYRLSKKQKTDEPIEIPEFIVKETNEICPNKEEYDRKMYIYSRPVWTCRASGKSGITFAQAKKSEAAIQKVVNESFDPVLKAVLLKQIHTTDLSLEQMSQKCWTSLNSQYFLNEKVKLLQKEGSTTEYVDAKIVSVKELPVEKAEPLNCSADGSDKENTASKKVVQKPNMRYDLQLLKKEEEAFVQAVTPDRIVRPVKNFKKETIKQFIRSHCLKYMQQFSGPWIADTPLVRKFSLPNAPEFQLDDKKLLESYKACEVEIYEKCLKQEKKAAEDSTITAKLTNFKPRNSISVFKHNPPVSPSKMAKRASLPLKENNLATKPKQWKQSSILQFSPTRNENDAAPKRTPSPKKLRPPPEATKLLEKIRKGNSNEQDLVSLARKVCQTVNQADFDKLDPAMKPYLTVAHKLIENNSKMDRCEDTLLKILPCVKQIQYPTNILLPKNITPDLFSRLLSVTEFFQTFVCLRRSWNSEKVGFASMVQHFVSPVNWDINPRTGDNEIEESCLMPDSKEMIDDTYGYLPKIGIDLMTEAVSTEGPLMPASFFRCIIRVLYAILAMMKKYNKARISYLGLIMEELTFNPYTAVELVRIMVTQHYCPPKIIPYFTLMAKKRAEQNQQNESDTSQLTEDENDDSNSIFESDEEEIEEPARKKKKPAKATTNTASSVTSDTQKAKKEKSALLDALENHDLYEIPVPQRVELLEFLMNKALESEIISGCIYDVENEIGDYKAKLNPIKAKITTLNTKIEAETKNLKEKKPEVQETNEKLSLTNGRLSLRQMDSIKSEAGKKEQQKLKNLQYELETEENKMESLKKKLYQMEHLLAMMYRSFPIGTDRNEANYYYFRCAPDRILIEAPDTPEDHAVIDLTSEAGSTESKQQATSWKMINTAEAYDELTQTLSKLGDKESMFQSRLNNEKFKKMILDRMKQRDNDTLRDSASQSTRATRNILDTEEEANKLTIHLLVSALVNNIIDVETRIRNGGLGGVEDYPALQAEIVEINKMFDSKNFTSISGDEAAKKISEAKVIGLAKVKELIQIVVNGLNKNFMRVSESRLHHLDLNSKVQKCTKDIPKWLRRWGNLVKEAKTFSGLNFLFSVFHSTIKWDKSIEDSKCFVCKRVRDEDKMLLCDRCNDPYHLYCLKPPMHHIPRGDWYCNNCIKKSTKLDRIVKHQKEEEEDEEVVAEIRMRDQKCLVCLEKNEDKEDGDEEEGFLNCSSCPAIFHLACHQPPIKRILRKTKEWNCGGCKEKGIDSMPPFSRLAKRYNTDSKVEHFFELRRNQYLEMFGLKKNTKTPALGSRRSSSRRSAVREPSEDENESASEEEENSDSDASNKPPPSKRTRTSLRASKQSSTSNSKDKNNNMTFEKLSMIKLHSTIANQRSAWPFLEPVDAKEASDYYDVVVDPIDLSEIKKRILSDTSSSQTKYTYKKLSEDLAKMFYNAELYNPNDSETLTASRRLEKFVRNTLSSHKPPIDYSREQLN